MKHDVELFSALNPEEHKRLDEISTLKAYHKGNILFYEGDQPGNLMLLLDGIIKVYKVDTKGNEIVLHFFQPQILVAETAHMQHIRYPATASCETDCKIMEIDYSAFEKEFLLNPRISLKIIQSLSKKNKALQAVISNHLTMDTFSRICKFIDEQRAHLHELSQRKIAAILNTTPETLSRNLATLKKDGIIAVQKGKIQILDIGTLQSRYIDSDQSFSLAT